MERIPVHVVRKQLGHASQHTTTVYLEYIAPVELADIMRQRS
jgi:integrase